MGGVSLMSTNLTIVVVEDNDVLREEMVCFLTRPGWQAYGVDSGEQLNEWLVEHTAHIAVLDVNLPYEDGYSISERLRRSHPDIGIVMLTARVRPADRSEGYQSGADVYLTKPTNTAELIAVIDNLGRRLYRQEPEHFVLDRIACSLVSPGGQRCSLTQSELRLLELMTLAPGREVDIDYLLFSMSGREERPSSREGLAALISRLRTKCKQTLGIDNLVVASRGVGYRLAVSLRFL